MVYKQKHPTENIANWHTAWKNSEKNLEHLKKIDQSSKEKKTILYRYFALPVADGQAFYQVVSIKGNTAAVMLCKGICLDEWADTMLGDGGHVPLDRVTALIEGRDAMEQFLKK